MDLWSVLRVEGSLGRSKLLVQQHPAPFTGSTLTTPFLLVNGSAICGNALSPLSGDKGLKGFRSLPSRMTTPASLPPCSCHHALWPFPELILLRTREMKDLGRRTLASGDPCCVQPSYFSRVVVMTSSSDCRPEAAHLETEMYPFLQGNVSICARKCIVSARP